MKFSNVEQAFLENNGISGCPKDIPYITVENFPKLGLLSALRFLEWVSENPEGIISLPTGKTPEYFIKWTKYLLKNWEKREGRNFLEKYGLSGTKRPDLNSLSFVQIDEFYPISSKQHNSFNNYVKKYYIEGFGLDPRKALLINADIISLDGGKHFSEVFPDLKVDLTLRDRDPGCPLEKIQKSSIHLIDRWCSDYESQIREKGGIGFFLGGIGPDGHIAFNIRGSGFDSITRLTGTNFETQAAAAGDLGGMEISRNRLVITIGLNTITFNPEAAVIIFAAGEAKAPVVKNALEHSPSELYPATVLAKLKSARFYLTSGAASLLENSVDKYFIEGKWNREKTDSAVINLCQKVNKKITDLGLEEMKKDEYCRLIPGLNEDTPKGVIESIVGKIEKGLKIEKNQVFYHTGPHHDDIMLGILPAVHRVINENSNSNYFSILTSGFTAVTNRFIVDLLEGAKKFFKNWVIPIAENHDFFKSGYKEERDNDVFKYLAKTVSSDSEEKNSAVILRLIRSLVEVYELNSYKELTKKINKIVEDLKKSYDGEKNTPEIQLIKGKIREFEEEAIWASFGIRMENIDHLRLGFYTGDIFTEQPNRKRDVEPVLERIRKIRPTIISLAFDPEGSGPDTHYKVLQIVADALRQWNKEADLSTLRIWGYRNVWYRFSTVETNVILPVSPNDMAVMDDLFTNYYLTQVDASFPSYQHDGKFSELTRNIWEDQLDNVALLLGRKYFSGGKHPLLRSSRGLLFFREMGVKEFLSHARELERSMEGVL
ncbi:MAG: glucosamine-6-phosphate isomerase [Acidobacteriota bacterium]